MPEAITGLLPLITAGAGGAGLIGNILNSIQQGGVASEAAHNAHLSPEQLGTMVSKATQPLDRNLVNTVNNQVQGDMASRGLAEAPGIFAATEGQALAPFEQQNQNTALQLILEKLGLPASTLAALRSGGGGMANLSPLLQMIMKQFPGGFGSAGAPGGTPPFLPSTQSGPSPIPGLTGDVLNFPQGGNS
jgi:hypothetical protein